MYRSRMLDFGRRKFLQSTSTIAAAGFLGAYHLPAAAEPPLETTKIRFVHTPSICAAPQYLAEELLRLEGFTDVEYLPLGARNGPYAVAEGRADLTMWDAPGLMLHLDAGKPIVVLAGVHSGCYELFGNESVHAIRDLKGKTVAIQYFGGGDHVMLSSMLAYVGMNPQHDVKWIAGQNLMDGMTLFVEGKADAFLGFGQQPPELRARKIGHVIVNTAQDRPWSQYFCCVVAANREFAQKNPVATKRALRAIIKGSELCSTDPELGAKAFLNLGYDTNPNHARQALREIPYGRWRDYKPEETIRFYALRLREAGMVKSAPRKLIAEGCDWRLFEQLKKEMKT